MNIKKAMCCLSKAADIPEVEAGIRILTRLLAHAWKTEMALAEKELLRLLDQFSDRYGALAVDELIFVPPEQREAHLSAFLAAFYLIFERHAKNAVDRETQRLLTWSLDLVSTGAIQAQTTISGVSGLTQMQALEEMRILLLNRVTANETAIRKHVQMFLLTRGARTSGSSLGVPGAPSREIWLADLRDIIGTSDRSWIKDAVDLWAYRWFNMGPALAAVAQGRDLRVFAVLDANTSMFCRWVHGRIIPYARLKHIMDKQRNAALEGDVAQMFHVWPMLSWAQTESPAEFTRIWPTLGIPPYHHRCRTRVQPV